MAHNTTIARTIKAAAKAVFGAWAVSSAANDCQNSRQMPIILGGYER